MASVVNKNEILLNSQRYKISGPVRKTLVSIAAPRFTIGDTQRGADPRASILTQNDFRGGIGWERGLDPGTIDRVWWSTCQTRYKGHLLLPRKLNAATSALADGTAISGSLVSTIGWQSSAASSEEIYAVFGDSKIYKYNDASDNWGSASLKTLTDPTEEAIVFRDSTASYLIFARGDSGYTYTTNGSDYTDKDASSDVKNKVAFFTIWHGQLWGIKKDGTLLQWASGPTALATPKAQLPLPDDSVTELLVYRDAGGSPIIYATTKVGLWAYDETNNRWEETELRVPFHEAGGKGAIVWRDSIYFPAGNALYRYQTGSNTAVVSLVGFDKDHGLPSGYAGEITKLIGTHNNLLVLLNGDITQEYSIFPTGRQSSGIGGTSPVVSGKGKAAVLGWNESAWEVMWAGDNNLPLTTAHVGSAYNTYRLWFGFGSVVYWIKLQTDIINPDQVEDFQYDTGGGTMETPYFDGGDAAGNKTAISLRAITSGCSSNVNIQVEYATDFNESYTSMVTITTNGVTTYIFGSGAGVEFSSIKFRITMATNNSASSPDLNLLELRFREKIPPKFGFSVNIDSSKSFAGKTVKQQIDNITTVINTNTLVSFTYKDNDSDRTYNVDLVAASGFEYTGLDERGQMQLQLVEL